MITQDRIKEVLSYSPETGVFHWKVHKRCVLPGRVAGNVQPTGYVKIGIDLDSYFVHTLAWIYVYGEVPDRIDHINRIKDDNRISNLRKVSAAENSQNMGKTKRNTTGFVGVYYNKERNKFHAQICANGKRIHVGYFDTAEEAGDAYKRAKDRNHLVAFKVAA